MGRKFAYRNDYFPFEKNNNESFSGALNNILSSLFSAIRKRGIPDSLEFVANTPGTQWIAFGKPCDSTIGWKGKWR